LKETILREKELPNDSSILHIIEHNKYFEKEVFVWDKNKFSQAGLKLLEQVEEEYK
jgi:hypothetical protein